jgi:hypothetical protein
MLIAQSGTGTNRRQGIYPARNLGIARASNEAGRASDGYQRQQERYTVHGQRASKCKPEDIRPPTTPSFPFTEYFMWRVEPAERTEHWGTGNSKAGTSLPKPQRPPNPASEYRMYLPSLTMLVLCSCPSCHPAAPGRYKYRRCFCKNPGTTTLRKEHPASPLTTSCLQTGTCGRYDRGRACSLLTPTPTPAAGIYGEVSLLHAKLTARSSRRCLNSSPSLTT